MREIRFSMAEVTSVLAIQYHRSRSVVRILSSRIISRIESSIWFRFVCVCAVGALFSCYDMQLLSRIRYLFRLSVRVRACL